MSSQTPFTNPTIPRAYRKHTKQSLSTIDRKAICQRHVFNPLETHDKIASAYGVDRTTISKILKNKEKWLNAENDGRAKRRTATPKYPTIEQEMQPWLVEASDDCYRNLPDPSVHPWEWRNALCHGPFTDSRLIEKALSIATSHGIDDFQGTRSWVHSFKLRHKIWGGFWAVTVQSNKTVTLSPVHRACRGQIV